ncbi:hypothetical protein BST81_07780 [Leptolyngbya sp. 'hensonii']|uniref:PD-(D/E)XK nuclease family protein n=1 Tax=Leptolyngbya sp. 'hensonii' TaxID=1922337 RepID=UPI00094F649C|nr:PD-(D/E)XK nuclease family protein [Leptolyngbya sp. 'hensonii']OLP19099.1 hypothetical protein BST81_07780 [Leptolyngbya sp. 'hensonii']
MTSIVSRERPFQENRLPLLHLAQAQLNLLETCPRKFQYIFLDHAGSLVTEEQQERLTWGSRFHLLMQQWELGLPVEPLVLEDSELRRCFEALLAADPELFQALPAGGKKTRWSEHRRTLELQGCLLTVIYDLLILQPKSAQILDWKTYPKPHHQTQLAQNWQTRLYLYVLAETTDYAPEQLSMTYWFVQLGAEGASYPEQVTFRYSTDWHEQTCQDLNRLMNRLLRWIDPGLEPGLASLLLPQVAPEEGLCLACPFQVRCQRDQNQPGSSPPIDLWFDLAEIEEVVL